MYALTCTLSGRPSPSDWDLISGLLYQFHSQGIEEGEEPAPEGELALHAANEFEHALEPGILAPPDHFTAYFENLRDAEHAQRAIEPLLTSLQPIFDIHEVEQKNYAESWKENFKPLLVPPCWLVRARWHERPPETRPTDIELIVEPGMAFGTGSHETTRACLELLTLACKEYKALSSASVLDFGCGSGILAIALKKLGVGKVYGVDIDPLAIEATQTNAAENGVAVLTLQDASKLGNLDGIVANILKNTLLEFAPWFAQSIRSHGFLVLSGLLSEQEDEILEQYRVLGFPKLKRRILENNWVSLWLERV